MIEVFMTAEEVAERLRISADLVYKMARKNEIPHNCIGKRKVFNWNSLAKWMADNQKGTGNGRKTSK